MQRLLVNASRHLRTCATAPLARRSLWLVLLTLAFIAQPAHARNKDKVDYGEGLIVNIPLPESEVEQVVRDVAQNGIIRGTKEYNKDQFVAGAISADSSEVFPSWTEGGKVIYKVRMHALDPVNFKDSNDVGTLAVRYVVQPQGEKNTLLRIDALFQEDFRRSLHASNGSVETSEYKDINEHLESIELMKRQTAEAQKERQETLARRQSKASDGNSAPGFQPSSSRSTQESESPDPGPGLNSATPMPAAQFSPGSPSDALSSDDGQNPADQSSASQTLVGQTLEQRLQDLRKQVQRIVKSPGAPLKTAPFHTASTLVLLNPGAEVLVVINTPYWYGVETHDGQHGWIMREQLEQP
jgi:hypothetical protein